MTQLRVRVTPVLATAALVAGSWAGMSGASSAPVAGPEPVPVQLPAPTGQSLSLMTDPAISADGRFVAFAGREGTDSGLYLFDRTAAETTRLETTVGGARLAGEFREVSVSADASRIVFTTGKFDHEDLVDPTAKVWLYDRTTGVTSLVSAKSDGTPGNAQSQEPAISGDGSAVAFTTLATDLAPGTSGEGSDVVLRDVVTGEIERVSDATVPAAPTASRASGAALSADGTQVAFVSTDTGLDPSDGGELPDAFVRDRNTGKVSHISTQVEGLQGGMVGAVSISADGNRVAFTRVFQQVKFFTGWGVVVHDRQTKEYVVGDAEAASAPGIFNGTPGEPTLSADGRFVAFPFAGVAPLSIYVRDLELGQTRHIAIDVPGLDSPMISADGRRVAFANEVWNVAGNAIQRSNIWTADLGEAASTSAENLTNSEVPYIGISRAKIAGPSHQIKVLNPGRWERVFGRQLTYQWLRNGTPIDGATDATYSVRKADFGAALAVRETASAPGLAPASVLSQSTWEEKSSTNVRMRTLPSSAKSSRAVRLRLRVSHDLANRPQGTLKVVWGERVRTVKVDRDGLMRVTLRGLAPGRHTVKVRHIGTAFVKSGGVVEIPVRVRR